LAGFLNVASTLLMMLVDEAGVSTDGLLQEVALAAGQFLEG
jgi:hypothetical protein